MTVPATSARNASAAFAFFDPRPNAYGDAPADPATTIAPPGPLAIDAAAFALERIATTPDGGVMSLTVGEYIPDERIGAGRLGEDVAGDVQASVRGNRHVLRGAEARPADAEPHEVAARIEARRNEIWIEAGAGRVAHHEGATIGRSRDAKGKRLVVVRNAGLPDHSPLALHAHSAIR